MLKLKKLLENEAEYPYEECKRYFDEFNEFAGKFFEFQYVGKENNKLYFEAEVDKDFGDLNLIIGDAFLEARVQLDEGKCNFEIYYTLTGMEEFSASAGRVLEDNGQYIYEPFDEATFTDDDLDEYEDDEEEEE